MIPQWRVGICGREGSIWAILTQDKTPRYDSVWEPIGASMETRMSKSIAGTEPGQRQLNGPQTTGRNYRNLSTPDHEMARDDDVPVPMRDGFIEAGASDFLVPRGYVHIIAKNRGSGGVFGFYDSQERRDMYDLVEWAAMQPWSDGNLGMIGISYFAMTQLEAAVEQPPHLKAMLPVAATINLYDSAVVMRALAQAA